MRRATGPKATVNTDEWRGYNHLPAMGRRHATVCHTAGEWARDDDGDGIREVHDNTLEGLWTGLRNFCAIPGREQEVPTSVCGAFRVGLQRETGDDGVPSRSPGSQASHQLPDMSQNSLSTRQASNWG